MTISCCNDCAGTCKCKQTCECEEWKAFSIDDLFGDVPVIYSMSLGKTSVIQGLFSVSDMIDPAALKKAVRMKLTAIQLAAVACMLIAQGDSLSIRGMIDEINGCKATIVASSQSARRNELEALRSRTEAAKEESSTRGNIGQSGGPASTVKLKKSGLEKFFDVLKWIVVAIAILAVVVLGPLGLALVGIAAAAIGIILGIAKSLVNQFGSSRSKRIMERAVIALNPINAMADAIADAIIAIAGWDQDSMEAKKCRMWLQVAAGIVSAIIAIVIAVVSLVVTCGASSPAAAALIAGAIMSLVSLMQAVMETIEGFQQLDLIDKKKDAAEAMLSADKLEASVENLKSALSVIEQNIEMLASQLSAKLDMMRANYDRASRILKDIANAEATIAKNVKA
jgi:hypothetical protein